MKSITIIIFIIIITIIVPVALAVDSSPSADIKAKLEELKKEIASKAAKLKQEVNNKLKDRAYVGKIIHPSSGGKTKSGQSLTLAAASGPKIVSINQDTLFESQIKGRKFSQKNILDEDFLVALGDIDETAVLTAKKIILLPPPNEQVKTHLWGQVVALSEKLITIRNRDSKNVAVLLPLNQALKVQEFVILTGVKTKNEIFAAEFVYIIPQGGFIKPKKIATPSAKPKSPTR